MFMDNFESFGVTADWKKVLPGMVYVDLQEGKSRKEIYHAYQNGAAVIFTAQNISDPELPVIKVNNVYETMLLLLNKHFHDPQRKLKLIAVSGSNDKDVVLDLLLSLLGEKDKNNKDKDKVFHYFNSLNQMNIEDIYGLLDKIAETGEHYLPIIVDYKLKYFRFINNFVYDCALITNVSSINEDERNYVLNSIRSFISRISVNKPIIVNNDDDLVLKALEGSKSAIVITYGLNKKAAVTATSIDVNQQTTFNYCLQRSLITNAGNKIEPFEMPVTINMLDSRNIYNALAAITCALYYDVEVEQIKTALQGYNMPQRRFELSSYMGITLLDHFCSCADDLDKVLEGLQLLNYKKLKLVIALNRCEEEKHFDEIIHLLQQWSGILGINEIVFTGCLDINQDSIPIPLHLVRKLKKSLKDMTDIKYYDFLKDAVEHTASNAREGEMIILAGAEEMNTAKALLADTLKRIDIKNKSI